MVNARPPFEPGPAAVCHGTVLHRRHHPTLHEFARPVSMVWIDPARPDDLFGRHPLWSARHPAPARFRATDYGDGSGARVDLGVRRALTGGLDRPPTGELRMLTQPRTWGWLFNPITIFLAWPSPTDSGADVTKGPTAMIADVTNTPWKERHRHVAELSDGRTSFDKQLHVSPFLDEALRYEVSVDGDDTEVTVGIDAIDHTDRLVLETRLQLARQAVDGTSDDRRLLTRQLLRTPLPTHRVSAAIHIEALRLWRKGVPVVPHPRRRAGKHQPTETTREAA